MFASVGGVEYSVQDVERASCFVYGHPDRNKDIGHITVKLDGDPLKCYFKDEGVLRTEWDCLVRNARLRIIKKSDGACEAVRGASVGFQKGGWNMDSLKAYFVKHQDSIIFLAVIIMIDHILFDGALRGRIQESVEKKLAGGTDEK